MSYPRSTTPRRAARLAVGVAAAGILLGALRTAEAHPHPRAEVQPRTGAQVYAATCVACHQASGAGLANVYPPLAKSEWVTGSEARLIRVILHGLSGPIQVGGQSYSSVMPPWGAALDDAEVAAVATYVRSSWGNAAAPVVPATVARLRAAHASRTTPWTAAELAQLADPVKK